MEQGRRGCNGDCSWLHAADLWRNKNHEPGQDEKSHLRQDKLVRVQLVHEDARYFRMRRFFHDLTRQYRRSRFARLGFAEAVDHIGKTLDQRILVSRRGQYSRYLAALALAAHRAGEPAIFR